MYFKTHKNCLRLKMCFGKFESNINLVAEDSKKNDGVCPAEVLLGSLWGEKSKCNYMYNQFHVIHDSAFHNIMLKYKCTTMTLQMNKFTMVNKT